MEHRKLRWATLILLSSGLLLPGACATIRMVLETFGNLMYIANALA